MTDQETPPRTPREAALAAQVQGPGRTHAGKWGDGCSTKAAGVRPGSRPRGRPTSLRVGEQEGIVSTPGQTQDVLELHVQDPTRRHCAVQRHVTEDKPGRLQRAEQTAFHEKNPQGHKGAGEKANGKRASRTVRLAVTRLSQQVQTPAVCRRPVPLATTSVKGTA